MRDRLAFVALVALASCMPPPVEAVDAWLEGYAASDLERVVGHTASADRDLLRAALGHLATSASTLAMALPPQPIEHEILEIEAKDETAGRYVVLARITMKNPLPYASERVGHVLPEIPKTRGQWRRFLSVREGDRWGVKLDLEAVRTRVRFVRDFQDLVRQGRLEEASSMLGSVPPPPDDANAQEGADRLEDTLGEALERARSWTSTKTPGE